MTSDERLRAAAEDAIALMSSCYMDTAPGEPDATIAALRAALAAAQPATLDVERLARALNAIYYGAYSAPDIPRFAASIAREYDKADTVKGEKD